MTKLSVNFFRNSGLGCDQTFKYSLFSFQRTRFAAELLSRPNHMTANVSRVGAGGQNGKPAASRNDQI